MARRIHVLHVCDKFGVKGSSVHGVSRLFSWWLPRFDARRFEVDLVGLRKGDPAVETLRRAGIHVRNIARAKYDPRTLLDLSALVAAKRPDIVHLHGYAATNFGRLAAGRSGARIVVHEHFVDPAMPGYQKRIDRWLASRTHAAVAVSRSVRDFMIEQRSVPAELVRVIYNGAPLDEFRPIEGPALAAERERWKLPAGCRVVGTIGRMDEQKGIRFFLEAAARIVAARGDVRFLVVGDGPLLRELEAQASRLGLDEYVTFTGYCDRVPAVQSLLDVQAFPSLWEGTPLTVFEAMSAGRAIVSTDVDGLGEVLRNGENALVCAARDSDALARGILSLLADPALAARLGACAQGDSRLFDIGTTVAKLEELYEEILDAAPSHRDPLAA